VAEGDRRIIARGTVDELRAQSGGGNDQLTEVFLKLTGGSALQELDEIAELLVGRHDRESEELKTQTQALIVRVDPDRGSESEA